jgi:hypothetical protein
MDRIVGVLVRLLGLMESVLVHLNSFLSEFLRPLIIDFMNRLFNAIYEVWRGLVDFSTSVNSAVREAWLHSTIGNITRLILIGVLLITMPSTAAALHAIRRLLERRHPSLAALLSHSTDSGPCPPANSDAQMNPSPPVNSDSPAVDDAVDGPSRVSGPQAIPVPLAIPVPSSVPAAPVSLENPCLVPADTLVQSFGT